MFCFILLQHLYLFFYIYNIYIYIYILYCIVNAWNFLPDSVDFSYISLFERSIHKVDFSRFLKCLKIVFMIYTLCFVQLLYVV